MIFPTVKIEVSRSVKTGRDSFGDDIFEEIKEEVSGVILAPASTTDESGDFQLLDRVLVELHIPKAYTASMRNSKVKPLTGPFVGRVFSVEGDSLPYMGSPLKWNRRVIAEELYHETY